ncbi:hypothetical protein [Undibacterium terreum]|uniref:Uncharacterized protein n=1 Tax=Undibacterium terreum TaxID=1224302 RepID=A0A916UBC4_9BURK|nr:hypothetical protein [Undibacterium terreum]GGC64790.1 hypothetical protein GCM10011396_09760 [Undibacterium terreum]
MDTNDKKGFFFSNNFTAIPVNASQDALAQPGSLQRQTCLRIAIYLARRGHCVVGLDALRDYGRAAGMNGAEMAANEQGTSHNAKDSACMRFVQTIIDKPGPLCEQDFQRLHEVGYSLDEILEVITHVALNIQLARMSEAIHSSGEKED